LEGEITCNFKAQGKSKKNNNDEYEEISAGSELKQMRRGGEKKLKREEDA